MILDFENKWKTGTTLRVKFLNGSPRLQARVQEKAKVWENFANIKFDFDQNADDAEVRVDFEGGKNDSKIGSDALTYPVTEPTMVLSALFEGSPEDDMNRICIHEFGHVLGLLHEHFHPAVEINWNKPKAIEHYKNTSGFTEHDCELNLFRQFIRNRLQFSSFDRNSIMIYPIPSDLLTSGDGFERITVLSDEDKKFIGICYPAEEKTPVPIKHGDKLDGNLTEPAQEDTYSFSITEPNIRAYAEASGDTNVIISFYTLETDGPRKGLISYITPNEAWQGGSGNNTKIESDLPVGDYCIRVRHFDPEGTGKYSIGLKLV